MGGGAGASTISVGVIVVKIPVRKLRDTGGYPEMMSRLKISFGNSSALHAF